MNKKGAEIALGTIIFIIIALVVLVVIIYFFTTTSGNLGENILNFGGGNINVQTVVQSCQVSCSTLSTYDYCTRQRTVVFDDTKSENAKNGKAFSCNALESESVGLENCPKVDCSGSFSDGRSCKQWNGIWRDFGLGDEINIHEISGAISATEKQQRGNLGCWAKSQRCDDLITNGWKEECDPNTEVDAIAALTPEDISAHSGLSCCVLK
jgi:hypothetical protein